MGGGERERGREREREREGGREIHLESESKHFVDRYSLC